jgi:hypothetical protein
VTAQNVADGWIGDLMRQIGERPDNSIEASGPIFRGHANNQFATSLPSGVGPRLDAPAIHGICEQRAFSTMPRWCPAGRQSAARSEPCPPSRWRNFGEPRPLDFRKPQAPLQLGLQDPVFGNQALIPQQ